LNVLIIYHQRIEDIQAFLFAGVDDSSDLISPDELRIGRTCSVTDEEPIGYLNGAVGSVLWIDDLFCGEVLATG
jgi:hypothetical protein|tara:strand:+ start:1350 stop:1571 length:222 start_codon:yes stop_codon:yes gene_type:complete